MRWFNAAARAARWAACLALCLAAGIAAGRPVDSAPDLLRLDAELAGIIATGQMPGLAIGIVANGQIVLTRTLGTLAVGSAQKVDANTRFRLASMTKPLSAALIGKLVHQGFLRWDTPVTLLVPSFRLRDPNSAFLTVEQLLSHRTGLPHHTLDDELEAAVTFAPIRPLLPSVAGECPIGACFSYQNLSYGFAADLSYAASGQFFGKSLQRELFEPLGMARANLGMEGLSEDDNWARPHEQRWPATRLLAVKPNYYWLAASAGVNASVTDMQQFLLALLGNRPDALAPQVIAKLTAQQIATPGEIVGPPWRRARLRAAGYGLGLRLFDYLGHPVWFHAGAVAGYRGMIVGLPEKNAGLVLMWNSESNLASGLVPTLLDRWLNAPAQDWLQLSRYKVKARAKPRRK